MPTLQQLIESLLVTLEKLRTSQMQILLLKESMQTVQDANAALEAAVADLTTQLAASATPPAALVEAVATLATQADANVAELPALGG
jgi:hypothetical protein